MTAILANPSKRGANGLSRMRPVRDLYQVAELVELCFEPNLDAGGRAVIREWKTIGSIWPLAVLVSLIDVGQSVLGTGFVWRQRRRVIGNVGIYRVGPHPYLGRGFVIANVAVHPNYRRRGIAKQLMDSAINWVRNQGGSWIALEVEAESEPAFKLYEGLGFASFETLAEWESRPTARRVVVSNTEGWSVRRRQRFEVHDEVDLVLRRARRGGMTWTRPIERYDFQASLTLPNLDESLSSASKERWILLKDGEPGRLYGAMWITAMSFKKTRVSLFLDPVVTDPKGRQALLLHALAHPELRRRGMLIEVVDGDAITNEVLRQAGFKLRRRLVQMRLSLDETE
ncbi:MAG: GNAT family N-acetyltransferase [Chloroflexi bacterium]|nr:GNAT family N-acetyltransferase [Chloroflexota bacterium]